MDFLYIISAINVERRRLKLEKSIKKMKELINEKVKNEGKNSIEVKKYKDLLNRLIKINKKLKSMEA